MNALNGKMMVFGPEAMEEILRIDYQGVKSGMKHNDTDRVVAITGYEGRGKSHLYLHLLEIWYTKIVGKPFDPKTMIRNVPSNINEFAEALIHIAQNDLHFEMIGHDEAGKDMYKRDSGRKFNIIINKSYMVIRGLNIYTILVIPSFVDLDTFFRNRRITSLFHVYAKGKCAYYTKRQLQKIIPSLQYQLSASTTPDPLKCKDSQGRSILPSLIFSYPKYEGELLGPYMERKKNNMKSTIMDIVNELKEDVGAKTPSGTHMQPRIVTGYRAVREMDDFRQKFGRKLTQNELAAKLNKSKSHLSECISVYKEWQKNHPNEDPEDLV